jgi:hypothetical protein
MLTDTNIDLIDQEIDNPDAFYPKVNIQTWQELYRVPGDAPQTLERQLLLSLGDCNSKLADWKAELIADALEAGDPEPVTLPAEYATDYSEAVFARAFGFLIPLLPSVVMDEMARQEIDRLKLSPDPYFRRSDERLARITGETDGRGGILALVV